MRARPIASHAFARKRLTTSRRQVFSLYREVIRVARTKPAPLRGQIVAYARGELEKHRGISKRDVMLVEHYIRLGRRQIETVKDESVQVRRNARDDDAVGLQAIEELPPKTDMTRAILDTLIQAISLPTDIHQSR